LNWTLIKSDASHTQIIQNHESFELGFMPYLRSSASHSAFNLVFKTKNLNWTLIKSDASHTLINQNSKSFFPRVLSFISVHLPSSASHYAFESYD
jgi:hypothetical protein